MSWTHDDTPPATNGYVPSTSRQTSAGSAISGSSAMPNDANAVPSTTAIAHLSRGRGARHLNGTALDRAAPGRERRQPQLAARRQRRRPARVRVRADLVTGQRRRALPGQRVRREQRLLAQGQQDRAVSYTHL